MVPSITWLFRSVNFLNYFHVDFSLKTNIITVKNSAASLFSYYCLRTKRSFILTSSLIRQQKVDSSVIPARSDPQNRVSVDIILVLSCAFCRGFSDVSVVTVMWDKGHLFYKL